MAEFLPAFGLVLLHEGGLTDDQNDAGGMTKFGISKRSFPDLDIAKLTVEDAKQIYLEHFWIPFKFGLIPSQRIANKVFDLAVNMGPVPAIRLLQQSLKYFVVGPLVADGKIGPVTLGALEAVDEDRLLKELMARAIRYHASLNQPTFLMGWIRRDLDG